MFTQVFVLTYFDVSGIAYITSVLGNTSVLCNMSVLYSITCHDTDGIYYITSLPISIGYITNYIMYTILCNINYARYIIYNIYIYDITSLSII